MSVPDEVMATSASFVPGPFVTTSLMKPIPFAAAPLASGEPSVMFGEVCTGGLQDEYASGAAWTRFGVVQAL